MDENSSRAVTSVQPASDDNPISSWKRQLLEGASELFESGQRGGKAEATNRQAEVNELYAKSVKNASAAFKA